MNKENQTVTGEGNAPRVELKNVKYAAFASQETSCFNATVYIDGRKAGTVENNGHGGSNLYSNVGLQTQLDAIAAELPDIKFGETMLKQDADILVGDLLNAYLEERQMRRLTKTKTLFRLKNETYKDGEWRTVKAPFSLKVQEYLDKKYGADLGEIYGQTRIIADAAIAAVESEQPWKARLHNAAATGDKTKAFDAAFTNAWCNPKMEDDDEE